MVLLIENIEGNIIKQSFLKFKEPIKIINVLNQWNKFCISYNFVEHKVQAAFNGQVSNTDENSHTISLAYDEKIGTGRRILIGRYQYDHNPFIGLVANVHAWDTSFNSTVLEAWTMCDESSTGDGSLLNKDSTWKITGKLVKSISVDGNVCLQAEKKNNIFLPIPKLTKEKAKELCLKFGTNSYIGGSFEKKIDYDRYYDGFKVNQRYIDECGYFDNGRLRTWLPYTRNEDRTALVHDITGKPLLMESEDKFYGSWYSGPQQKKNLSNLCVETYLGIAPKYQSINEISCSEKKCTACEIQTSQRETAKLKLRGLCEYSIFDKIYQVHYDGKK